MNGGKRQIELRNEPFQTTDSIIFSVNRGYQLNDIFTPDPGGSVYQPNYGESDM